MPQKQSKSWHEFWEAMALNADPLLATDFGDVVNKKQKYTFLCRELQRLLDLQASDVFLNVGCGSGMFESSLSCHVQKMVSLDLAWNMLMMARRINGSNPHLALVQGTATDLPFVGPTFDKVLVNSVTHYLPPRCLKMMLAECKRVLKPGGLVVIGDIEEPCLPLRARLRRIRAREGVRGLLGRCVKKPFFLVWQLYRRQYERYLVWRGRFQPVEKPSSIIRHSPQQILSLAASVGLQARVVGQGRGALYPNRFNVVIKVPHPKTDSPSPQVERGTG